MEKLLFLFSILLPFLFGGVVLAADSQKSDPVLDGNDFEISLKGLTLRAEQGNTNGH